MGEYRGIVPLLPPKWYYFRGAGSETTCGYSVPLPHTIADDMVSHHVITLFFVLLATRRIQKTVPSVGWYILPPKWQNGGNFTTWVYHFTTTYSLENQRVSSIFFSAKHHLLTNNNPKQHDTTINNNNETSQQQQPTQQRNNNHNTTTATQQPQHNHNTTTTQPQHNNEKTTTTTTQEQHRHNNKTSFFP